MPVMKQKMAFMIRLTHRPSGRKLDARIYLPRKKKVSRSVLSKLAGEPVERGSSYWEAAYRVMIANKETKGVASGEHWLQATLMAVEAVRLLIANDPADQWETDDGVQSWLIFPRHIPVAWGYDEFLKIAALVSAEERRINQQIERRRE